MQALLIYSVLYAPSRSDQKTDQNLLNEKSNYNSLPEQGLLRYCEAGRRRLLLLFFPCSQIVRAT